MKTIIFSISVLLSSSIFFTSQAAANNPQLGNYTMEQSKTDVNLNLVLVELTEGIIPKGFDKAWKTIGPQWADKVKSAAEVSLLSASLLELADNIKDKYYKPTWEKSKEKWVKQVKDARSSLALAGLLKSLYNNLNPEVFTADWTGKSSIWLETLSKIE